MDSSHGFNMNILERLTGITLKLPDYDREKQKIMHDKSQSH